MKMPKVLYVRIEKESNGTEYPWCFETPEEAIDEDGPTTIGVYKYVETVKRKKVSAPA
jgi:hypothetical protein